MPSSRKNYLDLTKGIAIILIVYVHAAAQMQESDFYSNHLSVQAKLISSFMMPLFFIISGAFTAKRLNVSPFDHVRFIQKVTTSQLVPFYSLSILFLGINLILSQIITTPSLGDMVGSILLYQSDVDKMPSGVLWFLFALYLCTMTTYCLYKFLNATNVLIGAFALLLKGLSMSGVLTGIYYLGIDRFSFFFIFFAAGFIASRYIITTPITNKLMLLLIFVAYMVLFYLGHTRDANSVIYNPFGVQGILFSVLLLIIGTVKLYVKLSKLPAK